MRKISASPKPIRVEAEGLCLEGELWRVDSKLFLLEGKLCGEMEVACASSGVLFNKTISQKILFCFSDGIYQGTQRQQYIGGRLVDTMDIVESLDGCIDLNALLLAEAQSIHSDYHYKDQINS
ncbi:hypothetical protein [Helicobacter cynogastricus]|uniref:hypothetical protein n=1 Tax=Helicobacter cynogastricus TaxID=329937 RepID=UPI001F43FC39|nr:hypothetical protein [Helicobacter cynogastricus]